MDVLARAGIDTVFTVPGGSIAALLNEAIVHARLDMVVTKSENGATFAAAGYARAKDRPGVAMVTSGPGVLNGLMGLASAHTDCVPTLLLVGEVSEGSQGHGALQDGSGAGLRIAEVVRPLCKRVIPVSSASALAGAVVDALDEAMATPRGPVVVIIPRDLAGAAVNDARPVVSSRAYSGFDHDLEPLARRCEQSDRTLILAGSGCRWGATPQRVVALAERLGALVATTPAAKGVFPESHPASLGAWGLGGDGRAAACISAGLDLLLVLGSGLGDLATDGFSDILRAPTFVQVDARLHRIGRHYPVTHAFGASVSAFADALLGALGPRDRAPVRPRPQPAPAIARSVDAPMTCAQALCAAQSAQRPGTRWLIDSGQHYFSAVAHLRVDAPDRFVAMTGLGAMGSSLGATIGTLCALPGTPVHVVCGDGAFAMMGSEISTAARLGQAPTILVMNDGALGMVELGMRATFGNEVPFPTGPLDVVGVARAYGAHATSVSSTDALLGALAGSPRDRPHVLDLHIAPYTTGQPNARQRALASEFQS